MKNYVIIEIGKSYALKEKIANGFFGPGLYSNRNLEKVKQFAKQRNMNIIAIGDIYEV